MKKSLLFLMVLYLLMTLAGCGNSAGLVNRNAEGNLADSNSSADRFVSVTSEIAELESGLFAVRYDGDYGFDLFLEQGRADSDQAVVQFLSSTLFQRDSGLQMGGDAFGCSTISVKNEEESNMSKIEILIGNEAYPATLYENEAANALMDLLPLTLAMSELNGNEKYNYLDTALPANASRPSGIKTGDLMLYGDRCLVLFYESFSTSYTYTALGHVDDPTGLAAALGSGSVQVTFRKG